MDLPKWYGTCGSFPDASCTRHSPRTGSRHRSASGTAKCKASPVAVQSSVGTSSHFFVYICGAENGSKAPCSRAPNTCEGCSPPHRHPSPACHRRSCHRLPNELAPTNASYRREHWHGGPHDESRHRTGNCRPSNAHLKTQKIKIKANSK